MKIERDDIIETSSVFKDIFNLYRISRFFFLEGT